MGHRSVVYEMVIDLDTQTWGVDCLLDQSLIGPVEYGWDRYTADPNSMTFGGGLLAGSPLPGTRRMIVCGYSPQWEGFYVSAMGGAMYVFHRLGVNYLWLRGASQKDVVLIINHQKGEYSVRFEPVDIDLLWQGYTDQNGRVWKGYYAAQHALYDRYKDEYEDDRVRILSVGPGARSTRDGAIGSNQIRHQQVSDIDDWAGRGGLGSRLLQHHGVAAIVYGGDWQDPALKEARELDEYFLEHFGKRAIVTDLALSQKYRYVPEFETGGTFGVNMHSSEDRLLSFNYQSIYATDAERLEQHTHFIQGHYLKQFNQESIAPKNFDHCGEPCAVVCKKYVGEYKKDYEPYAAIGPNCGIFDQRAAEKLNKFVDMMGLDAIQTGGLLAWILELLAVGVLEPAEFGLSEDEKPAFQFASRPEQFDVVEDSRKNAEIAIKLLQAIIYDESCAAYRNGIRSAAKWLDRRTGKGSIHHAVFISHGNEGCMVPNQYWVPGMFAPMPLMGKYFSYYEIGFLPPREMGKKNVERFVYELYSENSGSCRFHRKWVEDIIDEIILSHFDLHFDYWEDNFRLAKEIDAGQVGFPEFWESERVVDLIHGYLERWTRLGLKIDALAQWVERFRADKWSAAKEYWDEMRSGMQEAFVAGMKEPKHKEHGFLK